MCIWSCKNKFCGCFRLETGTKLVIVIDFLECLIIIMTYVVCMVTGLTGNYTKFENFGSNFIKSIPNYISGITT